MTASEPVAPTRFDLDPHEARVLGVLIEKQQTTPDQYPLTRNAVTLGCNQKSNRSPEMALSDHEVGIVLDKLTIHGLVGRVLPVGSRVEKYRHNAAERLDLRPVELAVLAELLLRGPQAPGELRTRASRMTPIASLEELQTTLDPLLRRGLVRRLAPGGGSRVERFVQTLAPDAHPLDVQTSAPTAVPAPRERSPLGGDRIGELEARVRRLEFRLTKLAERLGEPLEDGDAQNTAT